MHNKVVYRWRADCAAPAIVVLRFNFRGVGRSEGEHAHLAGEIEDARAALAWLRARYPELPFALAGFSFGSRVITRLGCSIEGARFLMAAGFPTDFGDPIIWNRAASPRSSFRAPTISTVRATRWKRSTPASPSPSD